MTTPGDESRTELAWREIVEHYGERPRLDDTTPEQAVPGRPTAGEPEHPESTDVEADEGDVLDETPAVERFHPPPPPPLPVPRTWQRGVAWSGIFVAPAIALLIGLLSVHLHPLFGWSLIVWFVGGFLYLVREMPKSPRDPWDDGSRV